MTAPDPRMPDMPSDADRSRGRYVHVRADGGPAGVDERWVAGEIGSGAVRIRSTRVAAAPASRLEADVRLAAGSSSVVLRWTGSGDGVVASAVVECSALDGRVEVRRTVDGTAYDAVLVDGPLVLPALVLGGRLGSGTASAFVVGDAREPASFLVPVAVEVQVEALERSDAGVVRRWQLTGGVDLDGEDVVDDAGLLRRRTTGGLTATLTDLTGPALRPTTWPG